MILRDNAKRRPASAVGLAISAVARMVPHLHRACGLNTPRDIVQELLAVYSREDVRDLYRLYRIVD